MGTLRHLWSAWGHIPAGLDPWTRRGIAIRVCYSHVAQCLHPSTQKPTAKGSSIPLSGSAVGFFYPLMASAKQELFVMFVGEESCESGAVPCSLAVSFWLLQVWLYGLYVFRQHLRMWKRWEEWGSVSVLSHFPWRLPFFLSQDSVSSSNSQETNLAQHPPACSVFSVGLGSEKQHVCLGARN